jgi:hypothetical protein
MGEGLMTGRPVCCDCGIDTIESNEFYMINDDVWEEAWRDHRRRDEENVSKWFMVDTDRWEQAWRDRRRRSDEILCIGCLEQRIGRTLMKNDFTDVPINDPNRYVMSDRLLDRLTADHGANKTTHKGGWHADQR